MGLEMQPRYSSFPDSSLELAQHSKTALGYDSPISDMILGPAQQCLFGKLERGVAVSHNTVCNWIKLLHKIDPPSAAGMGLVTGGQAKPAWACVACPEYGKEEGSRYRDYAFESSAFAAGTRRTAARRGRASPARCRATSTELTLYFR